ncbi:hypothetical protein D3Z52_20560 [Clostridiaceae bacterium]|nr:hypothetical protein [Clostridiaceae bacterium]
MTVQECQASVRARRKKRGRRLMIAYALHDVIFLLMALMIVLMVCEALYITFEKKTRKSGATMV